MGFHPFIKLRFGIWLRDIDCGLRPIRKEIAEDVLRGAHDLPYGFWPEIAIVSNLQRIRIAEVSMSHHNRLRRHKTIYQPRHCHGSSSPRCANSFGCRNAWPPSSRREAVTRPGTQFHISQKTFRGLCGRMQAMWSAKVAGAFVAVLLVGLAGIGTGSEPGRTAFHTTLNSMNSPAPTATVTYNYSVAYTLFPLNDTLVLGNVPIAGLLRPTDVAVDPGTGTLYVSNHDSANVTAINGATNRPVAWTRVGNYPQALAFDTANGNVYVPNDSSSNVSVIDGMTNHVVASVSVGINPSSIAFDPANGYIYVPNSGSDNVTVIDGATNEVVASIPVAAQPAGIAVDTANDRIFVSSGYTGNVTVIDGATNRVIAFIPPLGSRAGAAAFDPANGYVYISAGDKVVVVNGATYGIVAVITTNGGVWDLVVDRATGFLLATNPDFDTVTVIDGRTNERITTVPVGMDPEGLAFNPVNGYVYVANRLSGTLSLLASQAIPTYPVTFTEKGLPAGSNWSVNLDSSTWSSTNDTIVFSKPNGTHSFSVEAGPTYLATPANGIVVVAGAAVTQTIAFAPSSSAPMWFGLPLWEGYALVALILVLAVGLGAILLWRGRRGKAPPSPPMELRRS